MKVLKARSKLNLRKWGYRSGPPEKGGFTGISDEVCFYINKAGNPVIVFEKYEIAPGSAGAAEFEIESPVTEAEESAKAVAEAIETKNSAESQAGQKKEAVYEDNFAVETSEAGVFAEKIKMAVTAKDVEMLADLTAFPVYVGIVGGGVENREMFIALGEKVFTPGLIESVEGADISNLTSSMAGFSISKDGKANIIFGVVEGRLAISGINYE